MSEFGNQEVNDDLKPLSELDRELQDKTIADVTIDHKLVNHRIKLFQWSVIAGFFVIAVFVIVLIAVIKTYLCLLDKGWQPPVNFWHIPLMLVFMIGTILSVILTLSAKFGSLQERKNEQQTTNLSQNLEIFQEFKAFSEKTLETIIGLVKKD